MTMHADADTDDPRYRSARLSVDNVIRWVRDEVPQETPLHVDDFHHNFQGGDANAITLTTRTPC